VVIYLEQGADLHLAQLMPLPLTVSCFSKIQIGSTFLVPAHPGSPGKRAVKWMCVCVCVSRVQVHLSIKNDQLFTGYVSRDSDAKYTGILKNKPLKSCKSYMKDSLLLAKYLRVETLF